MRALHHAGIYVANLERSIRFYVDLFGLELAEQFTFGDEKLAFLRVGASRLELIQSQHIDRPRSTGVVDHVALEVDRLDDVVDHLRQRAVQFLDPAPLRVPELGARIIFCLGPDAERIELIEIGVAP